ncbi:WD40 repeat domain-containing protein [Nostoc sp. UHCC 0870]|uniref:WD40 repeat domain-containing protein n=1 Tax=Nostoc sp. UHCC 0870 TaxID=2914041 RepID=UPI001EDFB77A|nr:WD40 repeat domain-containing protein [Nostoc sp. UHCC 0870]UKO95924.1 WD40 repeat domain-containing protein [Nostoc sp. UHCC 0870]
MDSNAEPPNTQNNNQIWECLPTTSNYVDRIAFSPDGKLLASYHGGSTEMIKLWDVAIGQELYTANFVELLEIAGGSDDFNFCRYLFFKQNEKALDYTWTFLGFIWNLALGKVVSVKALQSPFKAYKWKSVALSPDLKIAVSTNMKTGIINLWETSTEKEIHNFSVGENPRDIYINQFSPDGKIFASLIWLDNFDNDETIKLWEVGTGKELCSIPVQGVTGENKYGGVLAFSSDSRILASNCGDSFARLANGRILRGETELLRNTILLTDVLTGQQLCKFEGVKNYSKNIWGYCAFLGNKVVSLAFSPDNKLLASGDLTGTITLWQIKKGWFKPLTAKKIRTFSHVSKQPIKTLAFSPDGQTLATGHGDNNGGITLWDIKSGEKVQTLAGHAVSASRVCCNGFLDRDQVAVSPDGKTIASSGYNDIIKLWDTQTRSFLRSLESKSHPFPTGKITFSQDGKFLVSVNNSDIVLWEVSTGKEIQSMIPAPELDNFYSPRWSSRTLNQYGDLLAIIEESTTIDSGKLQIKVLQVPTGKTVCSLIGDYGFPSQIIFSPDKCFLATRHSMSKFAIWDIATGRLLRTINTDYVEGDTDPGDPDPVILSPDGKILAIAGTANITLWQVSSGEKLQTINRYHRGWGSCLAFSPNGQTLAFTESSGESNTIKLWDLKTGSEICIVQQTVYRITSLNFNDNGQVLVSSYRDGMIAVWQQKSV